MIAALIVFSAGPVSLVRARFAPVLVPVIAVEPSKRCIEGIVRHVNDERSRLLYLDFLCAFFRAALIFGTYFF